MYVLLYKVYFLDLKLVVFIKSRFIPICIQKYFTTKYTELLFFEVNSKLIQNCRRKTRNKTLFSWWL